MKKKTKIRMPNPEGLTPVKKLPINKDSLSSDHVKVRITTYISEDIYLWLKRLSQESGTPYQILLNQKLRESKEHESQNSVEKRLETLEKEMQRIRVA